MPEDLDIATRYLRSPSLIFSSFGVLYLVLVWTSPFLAPLYLALFFFLLAFYLAFLFPNGKEWGDQRRLLLHQSVQQNNMQHPPYVHHTSHYMVNSRGQLNYTQQWKPTSDKQPKGIIVILHGYADHTSGLKNAIAHWLVSEGYLAAGIDYPGHGRSDGLHVDIPSFDPIVTDCLQYIDVVRADHPNLPVFLLSESMGGAVAFLLSTHTKLASTIDGTIFLSPMCQIATEMTPPAMMVRVLLLLMRVAPRLAITPTPDVAGMAFKDRSYFEQAQRSVIYYSRMPRLSTAANMLFSSLEVAKRLHELKVPFLICHGEADKVTDPRMSKRMYEEAGSEDKTLRMYENGWHSLLIGEEDSIMERVRADISKWLNERSEKHITAAGNSGSTGSGNGKVRDTREEKKK